MTPGDTSDTLMWVTENGGPIIRYLAARDLAKPEKQDSSRYLRSVQVSPQLRYWMGCLIGDITINGIHGSRDTCFENAMGKLSLFGMHQGVNALDRKCKPYLRLLAQSGIRNSILTVLSRTIVASMLAAAGYLTDSAVRAWVLQRLGTISAFVTRRDYSIHVDKVKFKRIPSAFRKYPLVNPDLYRNGAFALPWIYDMIAFGVLYRQTADPAVKARIEKIVAYVLDDHYQQLPEYYGIVLTGENRYNVMGWSVWVPGFNGMYLDDFSMGCLVQRLELMSRFPIALSNHWFKSNLRRLLQYATDNGTYRFPGHYIKEKRNSYFVTGAHMGLGENRRRKIALEIESSFWLLKILSNKTGKDMG